MFNQPNMSSKTLKLKLSELEDLDENIIKNLPWAVIVLKKMEKITKKAVLNFLKCAIQIDPTEANNVDHVNIFFECTENLFEELILDMNIVRHKHLGIIEKDLEKLDSLQQQLSLPPINFGQEDVPLVQLRKLLTEHLNECEKILNEPTVKEELTNTDDCQKTVENLRAQLLELWDLCHCSSSAKDTFASIYSINYDEDLIKNHEMEITKWKEYYQEHKEILKLLEEYKSLQDSLIETRLNCNTIDFHKNRGAPLLKEGKKITIIERRIQKTEMKLMELSEDYMRTYGTQFLTFGDTVAVYLKKQHKRMDQCIERGIIISTTATTVTRKTSTATEKGKLKKRMFMKKSPAASNLPRFKINQSKSTTKNLWRSLIKYHKDSDEDYSDFEEELIRKNVARSSEVSQTQEVS